ncbi:MAG: VWA domain-containing protein [Pirellulaceae bacterium]
MTILAQTDSRVYYELAPLLPMTTWWQWGLLLLLVAAMLLGMVWLYRRDTHALPRPVAVTLATLRGLAVLGLVIFFLGPQRRSEARIVKPSQLAVLVDTSLSMGLTDKLPDQSSQQRVETVLGLLGNTSLLHDLNQHHQLTVYRFGEMSRPDEIVVADKVLPVAIEPVHSRAQSKESSLATSRWIGNLAGGGLLVAIIMLAATLLLKLFASSAISAWTIAVGSLLLVSGVMGLAITDLLSSDHDLWVSLGWIEPADEAQLPVTLAAHMPLRNNQQVDYGLDATNWTEELSPRGTSTQLGAAIESIVNTSRGNAMAGIVVITDGRNNDGPAPARAMAAASDANIPVYVIGVGSNQAQRNARISDLQVPQRVFPGDKFRVKAVIQSFGMSGESARVQLLSSEDSEAASLKLEDERPVQLTDDGEAVTVEFEISEQNEGRRRFTVQVVPPGDDLDAADNVRSASVEILLRKWRVLLMAGGPTRDYQFLRNQLFRDENVQVDVWLQMARPGADQEADQLLFEFPTTAEALYEYDCIVAFDPDWRVLSLEQTRWLERWVSEKAGGMIVIAGPVFTPQWTRRARGEEAIDLVRALYPVSFYSQGSAALKLGRFGGEQPFPLKFSREGRTAEHLWLGDSPTDNIANWEQFAGVYGFYAVNEPKAGADILAYFSDPTTAIDDRLPIYLAAQFYGAGRVMFQASGEIWRLRDVDVTFFQDYYLNLIRWASQGRLLRDSSRGVLLVDRNRCWVGDQVVVRAILRDASDQPLMARQVIASVKRPDGVAQQIELVNIQDAARPGSFSGQFPTATEGDYEITLPVVDGSVLTSSLRATIPDLEKVKPQRDDALLQTVADRTGGKYFFDLFDDGRATTLEQINTDRLNQQRQPVELAGDSGLANVIGVVDQESWLPGSPDENFARKLSAWLLGWLTLVFCTEWVVRRLYKLA